VSIAFSGTLVRWGPVWSATTSPAWWISSGNSVSATRTLCRPSAKAPKSGSESASTNSDTTAGTAAHWTATTPCSDVSCYGVSQWVCLHIFLSNYWLWPKSIEILSLNLSPVCHYLTPQSRPFYCLSLLLSVHPRSLWSFSDLSLSRMLVLHVYRR